jgi:uncharacterized protein (TIGR02646 family)
MVRILFPEPQDVDWISWRQKCVEETGKFIKAISEKIPYAIVDLYKEEKIKRRFYLNDNTLSPFWRKCAYCEENIESQNGDIDHFRPKGRISNDNYEPIQGHRGYYWLTYDWTNLLPSCIKCNQKRKWEKKQGTVYIGKKDRFPLEDERNRVYAHFEDISRELPLLINPLFEDPEEHLGVQLKTGLMVWNSRRGEKSVEIFGLNLRENLVEGRLGAIDRIDSLFKRYTTYVRDEDDDQIRRVICEILKFAWGQKEFSLAAKSYLKQAFGPNYKEYFETRLANFQT